VKRERRVKVIATLGPASASPDMIERLYDAGADAFRINMSHTSHDMLRDLHGMIRKVETRRGRPVAILADLQGPKLRLGEIAGDSLTLHEGQKLVFDSDDAPGTAERLPMPHPDVIAAVKPGDSVLLDDGRVRLVVREQAAGRMVCEVEFGTTLSSRKGVSLPDTVLPFGAMTTKDRSDLEYALNLGVDWVALSFVQRSEDVAEARKVAHGRAAIMAKIEKPAAVQRIEEILEIADGIMVARGDLGVELPIEKVPGIQRQLTQFARDAGKPVVIATQMLESMIQAPVPTRAEVSDVATAVYSGADAIMLSAESAVGEYPDQAVQTMDNIALEVESDVLYSKTLHAIRTVPEPTAADAISVAARQVAETLNLAAILCWTSSGATGLRTARERPETPIITLTPIAATGRRLALVWGLHCVLTADAEDLDDMVRRACRIAFQEGFAQAGQRIIITAGVPLGTPGATNMLRIAFVGQEDDPAP